MEIHNSNQDVPAFLTGKAIFLRSLEHSDGDVLWAWFADRDVVRYSLSLWLFPFSRQETQLWVEQTIADKKSLTLGVVERGSNTLIGFAGIASISPINRSGEYFILIGKKPCWSKGYGTEVTNLVVEYGFLSLNLHRISLTASSLNIGGIKVYQRAGFSTEGTMRQACYRDGQFHDKVMMSVLRPEWDAKRATSP